METAHRQFLTHTSGSEQHVKGAVQQKPLTLNLRRCMHTEKNGWTMQALCSACWHTLFCLKGNGVSLAWGHNASPEARLGAAPQVGIDVRERTVVLW